jgi:deazaflavin-dependent oxidoreductase (nitroreductase family)
MNQQEPSVEVVTKPSAVDAFFNRAFGWLVKIGLGLPHNFLLEVRGRKSGRVYAMPVNLLDRNGRRYLVAPRGYTQWVKNALASGEAVLAKGGRRERVELKPVPEQDRPDLLKAYLDRFKLSVQRFFPIPAGSPVEAFQPLSGRYPVFEVITKP